VWSNPAAPNTSAILTWDRPSHGDGTGTKLIAHTIHYSHGGGTEQTKIENGEETWSIVDGLDPRAVYDFYVVAYTSSSASDTSNWVKWRAGANSQY
jgi:hypothetical protein